MEDFMARPTQVLEEYCRANGESLDYHMGRMSMALEMLTAAHMLHSMRAYEAVTAMETLLRDVELLEDAKAIYSGLAAWRRPKFAVSDVPYAEQPRTDGASLPSYTGGSPDASAPASLQEAAALAASAAEVHDSDQSSQSSDAQGELIDEGETRSTDESD